MINNLIELTEKQLELFKKEKKFIETNGFNMKGSSGIRNYENEDVRTFLESAHDDDYGINRQLFIEVSVDIEWTKENQKEYLSFWGDKESLSHDSDEFKKSILYVRDQIKKQHTGVYQDLKLTEGVKFGDYEECVFEDLGKNKINVKIYEVYKVT